MLTKQQLRQQLKLLGIEPGDILNMKVSMRSMGEVEGGANGLIETLLDLVGPRGTLVADAFVPVYPLPLSVPDAAKVSKCDTPTYAGAFASAMIAYPGSLRSPHPVQKFAVLGALAPKWAPAHTASSRPYALLHEAAKAGAKNIKIGSDIQVPGVGTTHVAIEVLGLKQARPRQGVNFLADDGSIKLFERNWAGGCRRGWRKLYPHYRRAGAMLAENNVGNTPAKCSSMSKTLAVELDLLGRDPRAMLCDWAGCKGCRVDWEFSNGNLLAVAMVRLLSRVWPRLRPDDKL
jgi:aminoglycoside 3-N-acetyltransferase